MQKSEKKVIQKTSSENLINGWYIARLLGEIGFTIALPLVAFLLIGRAIDIKAGTKILFTLTGMGLALATSIYIIYQKVKIVSRNDKPEQSRKNL